MEDDDDYARAVIERDLDMRALRTLQQWVKDSAMRYEAVGIPCGEQLVTTLIRVLTVTLQRAGMSKAAFTELMERAYECGVREREERENAADR